MKNKYFKKIRLGIILLGLFGSQAGAQTGSALFFDGINDYVNTPVLNFSASDKLTIEAWIKPVAISTNSYYIVTRQDAGSLTRWLFGFQNNGTILSFGLQTAGGYTELDVPVSATTYTNGAWHHIAAVYNGIDKRIYSDGVLLGVETRTGNIAAPGAAIQNIGRSPSYGEYFNGCIDEVRFWNVARTQCELNTYKDAEIATTAPNLVANYHFNQGIGSGANSTFTILPDAAATNNGTLIAFSLTGSTSNWVTPSAIVNGFTTIVPFSVSVPGGNPNVCAGHSITLSGAGATNYTWTGGVQNGVSFVPTVSDSYTVTGTNTLTSCSGTSSVSVTVLPSPIVTIASSSTSICAGDQVTLTASGAQSYNWTGNVTNGVGFTPSATDTYTVIGTDANTCTNTAVASVTVLPLPVLLGLASENTICIGAAVTLTATGATTYTWTGGIVNGVSFTPSITTTYSASGTDSVTGCTTLNGAVQTISVNALPTITISSSNAMICLGETVTFTAAGSSLTYTWNTTLNNPVITMTPNAGGSFTVSVTGTDANNCENSSAFTQGVFLCTGISKLNSTEKMLTVYPNPNNGEFTLVSELDITLSIINEIGQVVKVISLDQTNNNSVSLKELAPGFYFAVGQTDGSVINRKISVIK